MATNCPVALVHRSETRRKSCVGCVKAKRRCDLILPICSTCKGKKKKCFYIDGGSSRRNNSETADGLSTISSSTEITPSISATLDASIDDSMDSDGPDPLLEMANTIDSMTDFNVQLPFRSFAFPERGHINTRQFDYMVAQFKSCINSFVTDNQTPFIHPFLYQDTMPDVYQDALGVCSLYVQKTPRNQNALLRMLDCKLATLVERATPLLCRVKENLLALQILILYQVIGLFDGDARQRANAERHLELLDSWTLRLHQNYSQVLTLPEKESTYGHWVLLESIRRTTMVSVFLRSLYSMVEEGYCKLVPLMCTLPVSNTAQLWKVPEIEWGQDLSDKGGVLTYVEWTREWNAGNVQSVDEYEKLLLVTCKHANGTENFTV